MDDFTHLCADIDAGSLLELAFAARVLAARGDSAGASRLHRMAAPQAQPENWESAAWLWCAGTDLTHLEPDLQPVLRETARRLLPEMVAGTPTKTVAYGALCGALRAWAQELPDLPLQKWFKERREDVFARCTAGGRLTSLPGSQELDPSLLLLVHFSLFGPEDLLMVETVKALEGQGVHTGPARAWLAWYYQAKGTHPARLAELRQLLATDPSRWAAIARAWLATADGEEVVIRHIPTGYDHPYRHYTPERYPRDPADGQLVELRATVTGPAESLELDWTLNGSPQPRVAAKAVLPHWQEEPYWSATLGPFAADDRVTYRWVVPSAGAATEWHAFGVAARNSISRAVRITTGAGGELQIICADRRGSATARITLELADGQILRQRFTVSTGVADGEVHAGQPSDSEWQVGPYQVRIQADPFRLTVTDGLVSLADYPADAWCWWETPDGRVTAAERRLAVHAAEQFYGTGERFDRLDRRGTVVVNTVYGEYKRQGDRTYMPVPFLLSSDGYGLWAETDQVGEIDVAATASDCLRLTFRGAGLDLCLIPGPTPAEALGRFSHLTGPAELPPRWAFGPWMSSNNWDSQAEVERQAALTRDLDIPATVLVVEQWSDEATFYLFNDAQYQPLPADRPPTYADFTFPSWGRWPDPQAMVQRLHEAGLKVLFWQIPIWKQMGGISHLQHDLDEAYLIEHGLVVQNPDGSPYRIPEGWFSGSLLIDFTNPAAVAWWLSRRQYLLDEIGLDGFKTDGGEFVWDRDLKFADGSHGTEGRNRYANQYIGETYRFVQDRTGGEGVTFSRAGYTGAQRFPLHWAGDQDSTWDALRSVLIAGLNAGLSGIPYWGFDLAGFSGDIPTAELYCRSTAMACFSPVMQYHAESKAQHNQDRTPWNIAERTGRPEVLEIYRSFAHLRMKLLPYIYAQAQESHRTGMPMMRPLFLMHPDDPVCSALQDEYYFGADLLVAPILEPGVPGREVYLPAGQWQDFWTGETLNGPARVWRNSPLSEIPVFVRADAKVGITRE